MRWVAFGGVMSSGSTSGEMSIATRTVPNTGIWLSLTLRAAPDSSQTSGYFDGIDAKPRLDADSRLELPFTRDRQRIWDAVQAFYDGPVNDPVECSPSLLDGRPTASGRNSTG